MDDGSICLTKDGSNRYGKLSTHCFNYEEHILIQKYFKKKWNIDVIIKQEKGCYFIKIRIEGMKKLIKIIYKYVCKVPSMVYKVDLKYKYESRIGLDFLETYKYIEAIKEPYK